MPFAMKIVWVRRRPTTRQIDLPEGQHLVIGDPILRDALSAILE
jgi:hypothetical protein